MKKDKNKKRRRWLFIFPIAGMTAGLFLLLYPIAADRINTWKNGRIISSMTSTYDRYGDHEEELKAQLLQAEAYNKVLAGEDTETEILPYEKQLTFDGNGIIGYLKIPTIGLQMLIYHGTSDDVLAIGAGHLEGTSLPVGGTSTHSIITAHSGMKDMRAFDNLRQLKEGDLFSVNVLGRECVYEVESIETVLPEETESLEIVPGEDRVTLVTCTPYGINDHRLLIHGVRTTLKH